jgi:juvenile hormone acid methyltransferase
MFTEAQLYSESSGPQQRKAAKMLIKYHSWLSWKENEAVLDIGSGPGNITEELLLPFLPQSIKYLVCIISR